jgi:hypothetical protein
MSADWPVSERVTMTMDPRTAKNATCGNVERRRGCRRRVHRLAVLPFPGHLLGPLPLARLAPLPILLLA